MNTTDPTNPNCLLSAATLLAGCLLAAPTHAGETDHHTCDPLVGTFVTTVTDIEGVFSSRSLLTFGPHGTFLMTDSAQAGLPGVYDPFGSAQGAWRCLGIEGSKVSFSAIGLNFVMPRDGRSAVFGRVDYQGSMNLEDDVLSGRASLSFTSDGDLEAADPMARPGPVFEQFEFEGRAVTPADKTPTPDA